MERLDKENNYRRGVTRLRQIEKQISDRIARISVKKLAVCAAGVTLSSSCNNH